jgi:hypothetical protein
MMAFTMDTTTKPGSSGLHIAVGKANSGKPYLGDPEVVDGLVRELVSGVMQRAGAVADGAMEQGAAVAGDTAAITQMANILAGKVEAYETVGDWNPHGLGNAIREVLADAITEQAATDDDEAVLQAVSILVLEVYGVLQQLAADGNEQNATGSLEGVAGDFTNLFVGLPVVDGETYQKQDAQA